ncbi:MAG: hypothetical protein AB1Z98_00765 [Nannocystaceae bacterium]
MGPTRLALVGLAIAACRPAAPSAAQSPAATEQPSACDELGDRFCAALELDCAQTRQMLDEHELSQAQCEQSTRRFDQLQAEPPQGEDMLPLAYARLLADTLRGSPKATRAQLDRLDTLAATEPELPALASGEGDTKAPPVSEELSSALAVYRDAADPAALERVEIMLDAIVAKHADDAAALELDLREQLELDRLEDSLGTATRCVEVRPSMAMCWLTIAVVHESREELVPAREGYAAYLELAPTGRYAPHARAAIDRIERQLAR